MKLVKLILALIFLSIYSTSSFAESNKDCSIIKSDTAVKIYEKWRCKKGLPEGESLGKKIKNIFKKKNKPWIL